MIDLINLSRRWGLPRAADGDALQVPHGRLVRWFDDLAFVTTDRDVARRVYREVAGSAMEYCSPSGATLAFPARRLGEVIRELERQPTTAT